MIKILLMHILCSSSICTIDSQSKIFTEYPDSVTNQAVGRYAVVVGNGSVDPVCLAIPDNEVELITIVKMKGTTAFVKFCKPMAFPPHPLDDCLSKEYVNTDFKLSCMYMEKPC